MAAPYIQPYLFFGGRCDEALAFYGATIGAKVELLMRYKESPEPPPPGMVPPGWEDKVMHVTFRVGASTLMASDGCGPDAGFKGFSLSLALPTEAEAKRIFAAFADGGQVGMPLGKTFWSPCFGMVTDKFGVGWMVTVAA
jgi:PhnB protein